MKNLILFLCFLTFFSCSKSDDTTNENNEPDPTINDDDPIVNEDEIYFPSTNGSTWETETPENLGWDTTELENLYTFLEDNNTRAFIILKDGKIITEEYWGNNFSGGEFNESSLWYWASAGKTMTAFLTGIAQNEGFLDINDPTSNYLGEGWTTTTSEQENAITIKNQLTMTTGLDYEIDDIDCTNPECLAYKATSGTQWYYHNGPYTLLEKVVSNAANMTYDDFTELYLANKIGITNGDWKTTIGGFNNVYWSTAKDAARFGLLLLNKGVWNGESILDDEDYFISMVNSSQELNPAYGYLTWLNGKSSIIYPGFPGSFNTVLSENAPNDLYAAIGRDGQFVDIVPSENLVVIRFGFAPNDGSLVPVNFHNDMWEYLNTIIP